MKTFAAEDLSGTLRLIAALVIALVAPVAIVFPGYTLAVALVLAVGGLMLPTVLASRELAQAERAEAPTLASIEERQEAAA